MQMFGSRAMVIDLKRDRQRGIVLLVQLARHTDLDLSILGCRPHLYIF